jgi:hypothetical protein
MAWTVGAGAFVAGAASVFAESFFGGVLGAGLSLGGRGAGMLIVGSGFGCRSSPNSIKLMAEPKLNFDETIRNAWDGSELTNRVGGHTDVGESQSVVCHAPMVSIVGYTTNSLLKSCIPRDADSSGSGNRFLFCHCFRTKLVPHSLPFIVSETGSTRKTKCG